MMKKLFVLAASAAVVGMAALPAQAQATRTWVSGVGDDANPCSRTAPCKTFAGAISKTAAGGEISVLDPGGFGAVTITKGITINGTGTLAGILASLTNGIIVNAPSTDKVIIRGVSIAGAGNGLDGIRFLSGRELLVENVTIDGFTGDGIEVAPNNANGGSLFVQNTTITKCATGIRMAGVTANQVLTVDSVNINLMTGNGIELTTGPVFASVRNTIFNQNSNGLILSGSTGQADVSGSTFDFNGQGVNVSAGSTARIGDSFFFNNSTGIGGGGSLSSNGNNTFGGNSTNGAFNAAPMTVQ
jgi:hypothetical protein